MTKLHTCLFAYSLLLYAPTAFDATFMPFSWHLPPAVRRACTCHSCIPACTTPCVRTCHALPSVLGQTVVLLLFITPPCAFTTPASSWSMERWRFPTRPSLFHCMALVFRRSLPWHAAGGAARCRLPPRTTCHPPPQAVRHGSASPLWVEVSLCLCLHYGPGRVCRAAGCVSVSVLAPVSTRTRMLRHLCSYTTSFPLHARDVRARAGQATDLPNLQNHMGDSDRNTCLRRAYPHLPTHHRPFPVAAAHFAAVVVPDSGMMCGPAYYGLYVMFIPLCTFQQPGGDWCRRMGGMDVFWW